MTSKSDFEAWWSSDKSQFTQDDELKAFAWQVWQEARKSLEASHDRKNHPSQ